MKKFYIFAAMAGLAALAACGNKANDKAADAVENQYDTQADTLDNQADQMDAMGNEAASDQLENQADQMRDIGDEKAEAIEDGDANAMTNDVSGQ